MESWDIFRCHPQFGRADWVSTYTYRKKMPKVCLPVLYCRLHVFFLQGAWFQSCLTQQRGPRPQPQIYGATLVVPRFGGSVLFYELLTWLCKDNPDGSAISYSITLIVIIFDVLYSIDHFDLQCNALIVSWEKNKTLSHGYIIANNPCQWLQLQINNCKVQPDKNTFHKGKCKAACLSYYWQQALLSMIYNLDFIDCWKYISNIHKQNKIKKWAKLFMVLLFYILSPWCGHDVVVKKIHVWCIKPHELVLFNLYFFYKFFVNAQFPRIYMGVAVWNTMYCDECYDQLIQMVKDYQYVTNSEFQNKKIHNLGLVLLVYMSTKKKKFPVVNEIVSCDIK